jgi:hypothetical protein
MLLVFGRTAIFPYLRFVKRPGSAAFNLNFMLRRCIKNEKIYPRITLIYAKDYGISLRISVHLRILFFLCVR